MPVSGGRAFGYAPEEAYAADVSGGRLTMRPTAQAPTSSVRPALWITAFGDFEHRNESTGTSTPALGGTTGTLLQPNPAGGPNQILSLSGSLNRQTTTGGFITGMDFTFQNVTGNSDNFIVGALSGYQSSSVKFSGSTNVTDLFGPSVGVYFAYGRGAFSTDLTFKVDFLEQDQKFAESTGTAFAVAGANSSRLNNYSAAGNANYRFPINDFWYWEPTVGFIHALADVDSGAAALGLTDTHSTRIQGGLRLGSNWKWNTVSVNSTLTGIAFDTVSITGGASNQNGFNGAIIPTDEGKVFGQVLSFNNFDFGNGYSASAGADVRFGHGVVGIGVKGGLRYQW